MKNLSDYFGQQLILTQPSVWKRYFELKCNDEIIAVVKNVKKFGFKIEVEMFQKSWTIYRTSIWKSEIAIKETVNSLPFAKYKKVKFKKHGFVELPKGERLTINFKFFKDEFEIRDSKDYLLVQFKGRMKFKETVEIYLEKRSELIDKYPWVIILAWYLNYERKHSAAAAG